MRPGPVPHRVAALLAPPPARHALLAAPMAAVIALTALSVLQAALDLQPCWNSPAPPAAGKDRPAPARALQVAARFLQVTAGHMGPAAQVAVASAWQSSPSIT
jgi:hypothetical protein